MGNFKSELKQWQQIPREIILDLTMTDRARFLYCYMACKPDGWDFYMEPMATELGYSVDTLRKYMAELVTAGWLAKIGQKHGGKGEFSSTEYILYATRQDTEIAGIKPYGKNTDTVNYRHGKIRGNNIYNNKDINTTANAVVCDNNGEPADLFGISPIKSKAAKPQSPPIAASPPILEKSQKRLMKNHWPDVEVFITNFTAPEFAGVDLCYYYHAINDWSAVKDEKRTANGWVATCRTWMRSDHEKGKLRMIKTAKAGANLEDIARYVTGNYDR